MKFRAWVQFRMFRPRGYPKQAHIPMEVKELFRPWTQVITTSYGPEAKHGLPKMTFTLGEKLGKHGRPRSGP